MLALSPSLFPTTYAYPLQNPQQDCTAISSEFEARAYYSFIDSHSYNQIHHDLIPQNSISISSQGDVNDSMKVFKKLNHNASERDRRKKVNELYSILRSLLPVSTHQKKKISIPQTISRAVKYIPELQKKVEALTRKKEKLSSYSYLTLNTSKAHLTINKQSAEYPIIKSEPFIDSSVRVLGEKEVVIQLVISSIENRHQNKGIGLLSKVVEYFEHEEEGFVLLNSTTFVGSREEMSLNTLHLQAQDDKIIEAERLKEKLWSFHLVADIETRI